MVVGDIAQGTQVIVVGGGPGGYVTAIRAAQLGKEVTLVEKEDLGGVCLNRGCIPSKAIIHAADQIHRLQQSAVFGFKVNDSSFDMDQLISWKQSVVNKLTAGVKTLLKSNNVQVVQGDAMFLSKNKMEVSSEDSRQIFEFEQAIIATGSRSVEVPGFEFDGTHVVSSTEALNFTTVPGELVVLGGGYIGLELGTAYAKLGSRVTIIELQEQLLPGFDRELIQPVYKNLKKIGVEIFTQTHVVGFEKKENKIHLALKSPQGDMQLTADKLLVTVGRRPNTEKLGLEGIGVELDGKGFIVTDRQCRTNLRQIFAIGDVTRGPMLAHKASKEGIVAAEVIAGQASEMDVFAMPAVIYTDPEIATVGLAPDSAREKGFDIRVGLCPFAANGRALSTQQPEGFVRVVVQQQSNRILGVQIVGPEASSLIGEAALAIELGATAEDLSFTVHPHPSFEETLMEAAAHAQGIAIHTINRK